MPITPYSHSRNRTKSEAMNPRLLPLALVVVVLVAGGIFLATRDIPAPRHAIQKVIGNDRFFK